MRKIQILLLLILSQIAYSQVKNTDELYKTAKKLDSLIFDIGFNKCDLSHYDSIISEDLEFYHDIGGVTLGKKAFITSAKNNICGSPNKLRRELVANSMKVYPLYKDKTLYGLIQEGNHDFFFSENGTWKKGGRAKFTHLWVLENNQWKLKRVLSYDHQ